MGLFGKRERKARARRRGATTIIAAGTALQGDLTLDGNLHIDGELRGTIQSQGDVCIGAEGRFEGTVQAQRMVVSGHVRGRIECDSLEIVATGRVLGEVASRALVIEPGGQFVGESRALDMDPPRALDHLDDPAAEERAAEVVSLGSRDPSPTEPAALSTETTSAVREAGGKRGG